MEPASGKHPQDEKMRSEKGSPQAKESGTVAASAWWYVAVLMAGG